MYYAGRIFFILMGLAWGTFGILVIINPIWYSSYLKQYVDLTEVKWQVGGFFVVLGAIFIWSSFRREAMEAKKKYKDMEKVLMCARCVRPYLAKYCSFNTFSPLFLYVGMNLSRCSVASLAQSRNLTKRPL